MVSEVEAIKKLEALGRVEMITQRQADIRTVVMQAERELRPVGDELHPKLRRACRGFGPWMAGVAGLIVVAGGLYAASNTFAHHQTTAGSNSTGNATIQTGRYSALSNVPPSMLATFKQELQSAPIQNIMLPTKLPFTVTSVHEQNIGGQVQIVLSNPQHTLVVGVFPISNNESVTKSTTLPNETITSLSDGSTALYGYNDRFSQLAWGAEYSLASTTAQHKADLSKQQLISVADSFQ